MAELFVVGAARNRSFSPQARRGGWSVVIRMGNTWLPSYRARQWVDQCEALKQHRVTVTRNRRAANRMPQNLSSYYYCVPFCGLFYDAISAWMYRVIWLVNNHLEKTSKWSVPVGIRNEHPLNINPEHEHCHCWVVTCMNTVIRSFSVK
jgi:hypothetical protein